MPVLAEIGKYRRLAELFVIAMKVDMKITAHQHQASVDALIEFGLTERQADSFINAAFEKLERGLIGSQEKALEAVSVAFRPREHGYILAQLQNILEQADITEQTQVFFDLCCQYLYHEELQ